MFKPFLRQWNLTPDGPPLTTATSCLLPVRWEGRVAMLRISTAAEERPGMALMQWWGGSGAADVLAVEGPALLMARATGSRSLTAMARAGQDEAACRILCATAGLLHAPRPTPPPEMTPLAHWFRALEPAARSHGGILTHAATTARSLLDSQTDIVALHGDLHHANVLDFGPQGWLAIDPKGLQGERAFDFANIFLNPDLADPRAPVATDPQRFAQRLALVAQAARLDPRRLAQWVLAFAGLSMAWFAEEARFARQSWAAPVNEQVAALAVAALDG